MTRKARQSKKVQKVISIRNAKRNGIVFPEVQEYLPVDIRNLRQRYGISQAVLARVMNTTVVAVQQWEIGSRRPGGPSLKLLYMLDNKGLQVLL
jgi:putative transcriptional regulator